MGYAVSRLGGPIFGVGDTPAEALDDARQWLDGKDPEQDIDALIETIRDYIDGCGVLGNLYVGTITDKLLAAVRVHGGDIPYGYNDDGVAGRLEEISSAAKMSGRMPFSGGIIISMIEEIEE